MTMLGEGVPSNEFAYHFVEHGDTAPSAQSPRDESSWQPHGGAWSESPFHWSVSVGHLRWGGGSRGQPVSQGQLERREQDNPCPHLPSHWTQTFLGGRARGGLKRFRPTKVYMNQQCQNWESILDRKGLVRLVCLSIRPSIHLSVCLLSVRLSVCLSVCLSYVRLSVCPSVCLPSIYPSICLSVRLSVCLSVCCLSVCLSAVHLSIYLSVCLSVRLSHVHPSIRLPVRLSINLSVSPSHPYCSMCRAICPTEVGVDMFYSYIRLWVLIFIGKGNPPRWYWDVGCRDD